MSGPVPSNLVLLSELETCAPGSKVRFLGCVDAYIVKTATLRLKHDYPTSSSSLIANVDIEHVLQSLKHNSVDVGTWINVIGYMQQRKDPGVFVQAIVVWDAGNIDLDAYSKAIENRKAVK